MTDRELLELAAKAAGYDFKWETSFGSLTEEDEPTIFDEEGFGQFWNPLTEDGDALRLAVKIGMRVETPKYKQYGSSASALSYSTAAATVFRDDPNEQTRQAIVLCAAEIVRTK